MKYETSATVGSFPPFSPNLETRRCGKCGSLEISETTSMNRTMIQKWKNAWLNLKRISNHF